MHEHQHIFIKGEELLEEKKYLEALQVFHSLLTVPNFKRKSIIKLIEIYDAQNQVEAAINLFEKYLAEQPDDENMRTFFAQFLIRRENFSEAHDILSGVSIKSHPEKNFLMGMVNFYLKDYEISRRNFEEFVRQNKTSELLPEAHLYIGKCHLKLNEYDSALNHLKKSEELSNQNYEVYLYLGIAYYLKEMYFHALQSLTKSTKLNPVEVLNYEWSGKVYFKMDEFRKALKEFKRAAELKEPDSEIYALIGLTYCKIEDFNSAKKYFELALKLNPNNDIAMRGLGNCN